MNTQRKTRRLNIRLTDDEWRIINELANRTGMTISAFILTTILKRKISIYEINTQAILRPLLGLQRHYNTIRHWMITHNYKSPILTVEYEQELKNLWQLLAQAKEVVAQRDL